MDVAALVIYCADIGSIATDKFGWAREVGGGGIEVRRGGSEIDVLASSVAADLDDGRAVALGFECPQYIPLARLPREILSQRDGEAGKPWSAGAGASVLTVGLAETAWLLREVRERAANTHAAFLSWPAFRDTGGGLFLWEAFVTGDAKGATHIEDAEAAVRSFGKALPDPTAANAVKPTAEVHSLIGAALLRTGWTSDIAVLRQSCLVIRAAKAGS